MKTFTYVQKYMQWRKWRKIASLWRFEWDAKSGPLEAGHFGENGHFGKNCQRAGNNSDKRPRPLEAGNFDENGDCSEIGNFGKNRQKSMLWRKWQKMPAFSLSSRTYLLEKRSPKSNESRNVQQPASAILKCVKSLISPYVNFHEMSLVPNTSPH